MLVGIQTFDLKLRSFLNTSHTDGCVLLTSGTLWKSDAIEFDKLHLLFLMGVNLDKAPDIIYIHWTMKFYTLSYTVVERPMKDQIDSLHCSFPCSNIYIQEQPPSKHTSTSNMKHLTTLAYLRLGIYVALVTFVCLYVCIGFNN